MSRNGQSTSHFVQVDPALPPRVDHDLPRAIVAYTRDNQSIAESPPHTHPRGQLLYAPRGTLTTTVANGSFIATPERATWIPAEVPHVTRHSVGEARAIFVRKDVPGMPTHCAIVRVTPLLGGILQAVSRLPPLYDESGPQGRLVQVLFDCIKASPDEPLHLPMPTTKNLRDIAVRLRDMPQENWPIIAAAHETGMSARSFARHFLMETRLSFAAWRRRARLLRALELLGTGQRVGDVAFSLGYESTSAFIAMFRRSFGTTPAQYFVTSTPDDFTDANTRSPSIATRRSAPHRRAPQQ